MASLSDEQVKSLFQIKALYYELLWGVSTKYPAETRHQTALRYIREAEKPSTHTACEEKKTDG